MILKIDNKIIISLLLFIIFIYLVINKDFMFENFISDKDNLYKEIVIARYSENLEWLNEDPFNKYPIICYNSGDNNNFYKTNNMQITQIDNIGKEAYVYLYHIVNNYDKLADITIFLPGSTNTIHKINHVKNLVIETEKYNNTVFISNKYEDVQQNLYDFQLDRWCSTSDENKVKNSKCKLNFANIRPFGLWYDNFFKNVKTNYVNYYGLLSIKKKHIIQKPKEFYEKLLNEFIQPNDEVAHYFERCWEAIFYPIDDAVFIDYQ